MSGNFINKNVSHVVFSKGSLDATLLINRAGEGESEYLLLSSCHSIKIKTTE